MGNRHGTLADQLTALMAYRNRPEGEPEPIKTNWTTIPANDNAAPDEIVDYGFERNLLVTPSVREIMRQVKTGEVVRNDAGQVVAIGKLRFSDGTQKERGYTRGPDGDVIRMDVPMPTGSMLGTIEKAKEQAGGKGYTRAQLERSNDYFAETLGTIAPRYIKRTRRKNGPSITAVESRAVLEKAIANTPRMPAVKKYRPGLPCGSPRVADSFIGMQKGKKGESGAIMWQDIASSKVQREIWDETLAALTKEDIATLDAALTARTMREIGEAHGFVGKRAERMGRRILVASNDNLAGELKKSAA